ncbi:MULTISPECIES: CsbD family protein [Bradyrhizobium]|uniref:CsbD family protein n=1 Tax=Bradyrhizobium elkanii TaxID=29448 RepID=UPI0027148A52|nr:CsbD family protein [Bradyrhizobium elkanii]WLA47471.1 CsbD family protein [Bradyrhizobium elkanii]WLB82229.1 CsbD family protein [Bradyrhizobium elkanii]
MDKDRIFGTAKEFAGKAEGAVGDAAGDAQTQASGRVREAAGSVQDLYGQAKDAARDAADTAVNYAKDAYEHRGETVRSGQKAMAHAVQENPLGSLLIAGGIGFALALLMTRQPRRPPPSRWRYYG